MVCCDKVISPLFLYILQSLTEAVYRNDQIDKVGKCIEWLTDELVHIRVLTEYCIYAILGIKPFPYRMPIEYIIQDGDNRGKNYRTDYR